MCDAVPRSFPTLERAVGGIEVVHMVQAESVDGRDEAGQAKLVLDLFGDALRDSPGSVAKNNLATIGSDEEQAATAIARQSLFMRFSGARGGEPEEDEELAGVCLE